MKDQRLCVSLTFEESQEPRLAPPSKIIGGFSQWDSYTALAISYVSVYNVPFLL